MHISSSLPKVGRPVSQTDNFRRSSITRFNTVGLVTNYWRATAAFLLAGASGFVVDAGVLTALVHWGGWGAIASRAVSFPIALTVTWMLNRAIVFRGRRASPILIEYVGYAAIQVTGAATNLAIFSACVLLNERLSGIPIVPLAIGAIFGLVVNFTLLNWGLYRSR